MKNLRFLFRAWDEKLKRMYYSNSTGIRFYDIRPSGVTIMINYKSKFYKKEISAVNGEYVTIDNNPKILLQCIGLLAKNANPIYEGDILDNKECCDARYKVIFINTECGRHGFYCENLTTYSIKSFGNPDIDLNELEIVGNIFENKEVLNE